MGKTTYKITTNAITPTGRPAKDPMKAIKNFEKILKHQKIKYYKVISKNYHIFIFENCGEL